MKQIDAKNIIKTMNWIMTVNEDNQTILEPIQNSLGIFECEIKLPLINKTVIGIGDCKIDSIDNATTKAVHLIENYLKQNPSFEIKNILDDKKYLLEETNKGFLTLIQTSYPIN